MKRLALALLLVAAAAIADVAGPDAVGAASPPIKPLISAGGDHVCVVSSSGEVSCWGRNLFGQVGNGTFTNTATAGAVTGLSPVVAVASGGAHTCVAFTNGGVDCWGFNNDGQLGNGTNANSSVPVVVQGVSGASRLRPATCTRARLSTTEP